MSDDNMKQIHIEVPMRLYEEVKEIMPERGLVTSLLRKCLQRFVAAYKEREVFSLTKSPSDEAIDSLIEDEFRRR